MYLQQRSFIISAYSSNINSKKIYVLFSQWCKVITMETMSPACYQKMNYDTLSVLPSVFLSSITLSFIEKVFQTFRIITTISLPLLSLCQLMSHNLHFEFFIIT